jgi:hypothetical protein
LDTAKLWAVDPEVGGADVVLGGEKGSCQATSSGRARTACGLPEELP